MRIRGIQSKDLETLLALCAEHAEYEGLPFQTEDQMARWQTALFGPQPKLFGWVCEEQDQLLGYMTATIDFATWTGRLFAYMDCLYLKPEARGQGLGRQFMAILTDFARARDCSEIQWQTPPDNELGIGFYRRIGAGEKSKARFFLPVKED